MLMRTICLELAPHNITVNNIGPGAIDTPIDADVKADPKKYQALLDEIPLHRMDNQKRLVNWPSIWLQMPQPMSLARHFLSMAA
nr:SDR family oxidoreductase [Dictyobacter vulcani]